MFWGTSLSLYLSGLIDHKMFEIFRAYLLSHAELSEADLILMEETARFKRIRKRQYLLQEGDVCRHNCFVINGLLRTFSVDEKGNEHVIRFAAENWWISDRESLMSEQPSKFNIDAIEDTSVLLFTKNATEMLMEKIPAFGKMINDMLSKSLISSQNRIHEVISHSAEENYLNFIKRFPDFAMRVPQGMIASYLGIKPETLSRLRGKR